MKKIYSRVELLADETGAVCREAVGRVRVALCYPNSYAVGMANLGFQTIYRLLNERDDVVCERVFLDTGASGRTLESDTPLGEMEIIAFSISFELDYPNVLRMLLAAGITPYAAERYGPTVIAGGATMSYNPEPLAPFLDAVLVGEAEETLGPLIDALIAGESPAGLPGVYVPAAPGSVTRQRVDDLSAYQAYTQVYSSHSEFGNMTLIEIGRGCPYGCRFCVASHCYRPARWRSMESMLPIIQNGLLQRKRVGLIGASVTDHPQIIPLCEEILRLGGEPSPASMRADALTPELLALLARGGTRSITLAPETGREELRRSVGKHMTDESLFAAVLRARAVGINHVKLYFIIGLPGEMEEDVAAIPALALRLAKETGARVSLGCSAFVPKPGTPFARMPMAAEKENRRKLESITRALRGRLDYTHESARWAAWQGVLARGDRSLAPALLDIAAALDTPAAWRTAFRAHGINPAQFSTRDLPAAEALVWDFINTPTNKSSIG